MQQFFDAVGQFFTAIFDVIGGIVDSVLLAVDVSSRLAFLPVDLSGAGFPAAITAFLAVMTSFIIIRIILKVI